MLQNAVIFLVMFVVIIALSLLVIALLNERSQLKPIKKSEARRASKESGDPVLAGEGRAADAADRRIAQMLTESALQVPPPDVRKIEAVAPRND